MVLVQRGTPVPPLTGELAGAQVIEIPVETVAGNADDAPTRFLALGVEDKLLGLGHEGVYDEHLRQRFVNGELVQIGASWHTGPNLEVLLSIQPELTLLTAASLQQSEGISKTRELGLSVAPEFSWSETSFLGQLEWIKYDALFFNAEAVATAYFDRIRSRCDSLQNLVNTRREKPGVLWGMHNKSGSWTLRANDAIAQLLEAAGAVNPFADTTAAVTETKANGLSEGIQISDEIVLGQAPAIDYIISFQSTTENWPPATYMNSFPAYRNGRLFHHFKRFRDYGAHDWYQTAPMRPDLLLMDLIKLFHPDVLPAHELFFLETIEIK
jgi:ABC-type Fe3+-hydroxamate transport system substrate-binding protein